MPPTTWTIGLIGLVVLAAAVPYVARIRHPDQKPFAAYLLFVSVFITVAAVLFGLLSWLLTVLDRELMLNQIPVALAYVILIFLPALLLGTWQTRKPPIRRRPP